MSYAIVKKALVASSGKDLWTIFLSELESLVPEFQPVRSTTSSDSKVSTYSFNGENGGIRLEYSVKWGDISFTASYAWNMSSTTENIGYGISRVVYVDSVDGVSTYRIGLIAIRTSSGIMICLSNNDFSVFTNYLYFGYVTSAIKGKLFVGMALSSAGYTYFSRGNDNYSFTSNTNTSNGIIIPTATNKYYPAALSTVQSYLSGDALDGSIIASPVYLQAADIWIEPIHLDSIYYMLGRTYPQKLSPVTIGGLTLMRFNDSLAIS